MANYKISRCDRLRQFSYYQNFEHLCKKLPFEMGATKLLVQIFWAIVSDRAENLGKGSEAQVSKV